METKWKPKFWRTIPNATAPGGNVDAYLIVDSESGESMITLAVPHGDKTTPVLVCDAVNSHASLTAALDACVEALQDALPHLHWSNAHYRICVVAIEAVNAALEQAKKARG